MSAKTGVPRPPIPSSPPPLRSAIGQLMADPPSPLVTDKLSAMISCRLTPLTWNGAALKMLVFNLFLCCYYSIEL